MVKLASLINPKCILLEDTEEKQMPDKEFTVLEKGLEHLKAKIAALNKKAAKYKVPSLDIDIIKEEMVKAIHPDIKKMQMQQSIIMPLDKGLLADPKSWVMVKQYTVRIDGEAPHIDGYEFIARLEHTPEGNIIFTNPKSSVPNLPSEFKTMNQKCDVCNTNRDRHDTFVIKMTVDDPLRFPDKKAGDMLIVGRNCLARFMPGISIAGLILYTQMIENMQAEIKEAKEIDEMGGSMGGNSYYEDADFLLIFLSGVYLLTGRYISKKQAQADFDAGKNSESTLSRARHEMRPNLLMKNPEKSYPVYFRFKEDPAFLASAEKLASEFNAWVKTKDFDAMAAAKPDFADFFHNLKIVSGMEYLKGNHFGFFAALFQLFLRDKNDAEKKADAEKTMAALPPSPVKFDETLVKQRLRDVAKNAEIQRLTAGGMDEKAIKKAVRGKDWGWEVIVNKITEYEKTQTFGYGDSGIGYRINFRDDYGNDFLWFAGTTLDLKEGNKYIIDGTIVGYEPVNKYTNRPQTRINRVKVIKDYANPNKPPQAEPPTEQPVA